MSPDLTLPKWILDQALTTSVLREKIMHKSFTQIQTSYSTPATDYFNFHRIQKCLAAHTHLEGALPTRLWHFFFSNNTDTKDISPIYTTLQEKIAFHKSKPYTDWEEDLQSHFSDQQRQKALNLIYKATCYTSLWELMNKITLRWYLTPH